MVLIVISGCVSGENGTTSNGTSHPQYELDINVSDATYDYFSQDSSASGGCDVINNGNITYKKVLIDFEVYDVNGNEVGNETITVGKITPGEEINYAEVHGKPIPTGVSASATLIKCNTCK